MPLLAILIFLGTCQSMWAQVATGYTFASTNGAYVPITGTIVSPTTGTLDDEILTATSTPALPGIGFTFNFNGTAYTTCTLSSNGFITFGTGAVSGITPVSGAATYAGAISVFGRDLVQRTVAPLSELRVQTVGIAPNREYVIQFSDWGLYNNITNGLNDDVYNFQIRLQENGNKIVFSYGSYSITAPIATQNVAPQVGLRGTSNTDFNNRSVTPTGTWAASTAGTANTAVANISPSPIQVPPNGLTYTWSPIPCSAVPAVSAVIAPSLPIASSQFLACAGRPFTLGLSAANIGNTFQWQSTTYTPGPNPTVVLPYIDIPGANGATYTATQTGPTAYRCTISCSVPTPVLTITAIIASRVLVGMSPSIDCYCVATTAPNVACITNVTLGSINNTTGCAPNVNHVATNTGVTTFPSNITTSLALGSSPAITVSTATSASVGVWVDFNANNQYEITEFFSAYITGTTGTVNVSVPVTATVGLTKMRVRSRLGTTIITNANACTPFPAATSGETEDYYVTINPAGCSTVVVSPLNSVLNITKDVAVSITPTASGGAAGATYTYALTSGTLPVGVTFVGGVISGTPTVLENGSFTITATSITTIPSLCQGSMVYNFNVKSACATPVVITATPAPVATAPSTVVQYNFIISKSESIQLASTGDSGSVYSYAITAGALPSGLLLNIGTGIIAGIPNTVGGGTFTVTSTSVTGNCSISSVYTYTTVCPTVVLSPAGGALSLQWNNEMPIEASGDAAYTFTITGTLPTGVTLTPAGITGTPTLLGEAGTFTVTVNTTTLGLPIACTAVSATYNYKVVCSNINVSPVIPNIVFTKGFAMEDIVLSASEIGSTPLYNYAVTGLPAGVTFVTIPATTTPVASAIYKITGTPTTLGKGIFVVTATNPNAVALLCNSTSSFAYTVIDNPTTSLDALSSQVKVSPNPSKGEFNIDFNGIALGKAVIRVYDAQGKQVYTSNVSNNQMVISLENLSSGIYLMEVDSAKGRILKRLAKQ